MLAAHAHTHLLCVFKAEGVSHNLRDRFVALDESLLFLPLFEVRFEAEEGLLRIRRATQNAKGGYDVVQRLHLAVLQFRSLVETKDGTDQLRLTSELRFGSQSWFAPQP